jgi:hypothetical protein
VPNNTWRNYSYILPIAAKKSNLVIKITTNDDIRPPGNIGFFYTSIDDIKTDNSLLNFDYTFQDFKVYPNPVKDNFIVEFGDLPEIYGYSIIITNIQGQEIYRSEINDIKFKIRNDWNLIGVNFVLIFDNRNRLILCKKIIFL